MYVNIGVLTLEFLGFQVIGITHVFSCFNICHVKRKLFDHEAGRQSIQTSPEGTVSLMQ